MHEAKWIAIPSSDLMADRSRGSCLSGSLMKEHVWANISTIYTSPLLTQTKKLTNLGPSLWRKDFYLMPQLLEIVKHWWPSCFQFLENKILQSCFTIWYISYRAKKNQSNGSLKFPDSCRLERKIINKTLKLLFLICLPLFWKSTTKYCSQVVYWIQLIYLFPGQM